MVDAVIEATYDFWINHSSAYGIHVISPTDIRILAFDPADAKPRIYKYTPNYDSHFDPVQNLNSAGGLTYDGTYLWYITGTPCFGGAIPPYGIRKVKPDSTGYLCVSNTPNTMNALTYHDGSIYGYQSGKIWHLEADYSWTEHLDLIASIGNFVYYGVTSVGVNFLVNEHTNNQIHYVTSGGSHLYTWNFAPCANKGRISWDGKHCWLACDGNNKLYKLSLPPLPFEGGGSALPLFAKILL